MFSENLQNEADFARKLYNICIDGTEDLGEIYRFKV